MTIGGPAEQLGVPSSSSVCESRFPLGARSGTAPTSSHKAKPRPSAAESPLPRYSPCAGRAGQGPGRGWPRGFKRARAVRSQRVRGTLAMETARDYAGALIRRVRRQPGSGPRLRPTPPARRLASLSSERRTPRGPLSPLRLASPCTSGTPQPGASRAPAPHIPLRLCTLCPTYGRCPPTP